MKPANMRLVLALLCLFGVTAHAAAQNSRKPGDFDFYVLALSWSPAWCAESIRNSETAQCRPGRRLGFVVHGLWPQYESGYPEFCRTREGDRVPSSLGSAYLDIVPSMGLMGHQWRKHGSCSGLRMADYFATLRKAYEAIAIPTGFDGRSPASRIDADALEAAFIAANPGLTRDAIAVDCDGSDLSEIRICLSKDLRFATCREVDRKGCQRRGLAVEQPR